MFEKLFPVRYSLMYAIDVTRPRSGTDNTGLKEFRTVLGLLWFVATDKQARNAVLADRAVFITIKDR